MEAYRLNKSAGLDRNLKEYLREIHSAQKEISIVSGRLNPFIYEREEVLDEFKWHLVYGTKINLVFNKQDEQALEKENKGLMKLVSQFKDNIHVTIIPLIPKRQYLITEKSALVQEEHNLMYSRDLYVFRDDPKTALKWKNTFEKLVQAAEKSN